MRVPHLTFRSRWWLVFLALVVAGPGCGGQSAVTEPPDDEAMTRLKRENTRPDARTKTADEAAREYFLPKYYYDPTDKDKKANPPNYLKGMDRIAVKSDAVASPNAPLWLQAPVYQLLDKQVPEFKIEDPANTPEIVLGRNTWMLWCGGNEGFWDWLASDSLGFVDMLKLIDSRDRLRRFEEGGLINEPQMMQNGEARKDGPEFGLWLDIPVDGRTRKWRNDYLKKTFDSIRAGQHESQRGIGTDKGSGYPAGGSSGYGMADKSAGGYGAKKGEEDGYQK